MKDRHLNTRIFSRGAVIAVMLWTAVITACSPDVPGHSEWQSLPAEGWSFGDTLVFNAVEPDTLPVPAMVLNVRHSDSYPYANLWMEVSYDTADSIARDTVNVVLADEFGHWYGQGNGVSFQFTDTIVPRQTVRPGSAIRLRHIVRTDTLPDIEQIGITF